MVCVYGDCEDGDAESFDDAAEEEGEECLQGPDIAGEDSQVRTGCLS
jgi:hypothetical protein